MDELKAATICWSREIGRPREFHCLADKKVGTEPLRAITSEVEHEAVARANDWGNRDH